MDPKGQIFSFIVSSTTGSGNLSWVGMVLIIGSGLLLYVLLHLIRLKLKPHHRAFKQNRDTISMLQINSSARDLNRKHTSDTIVVNRSYYHPK